MKFDLKKSSVARKAKARVNGIRVVQTAVEVLRLPEESDAKSVQWFSEFVSWVIRKGPVALSDRQLLIGTVLATEAVVSKNDLFNALGSLKSVCSDTDGNYVSWEDGATTCRLRISHFTSIAAGRIVEWPESWEEESEEFFSCISVKFTDLQGGNFEEQAKAFFDRAIQWFYFILPPPCSNFLSGVLPLSLLPQEVLNRRVGIKPPLSGIESKTGVLNSVMDAAVDRLHSDSRTNLVSKLVVVALKSLFQGETEDSVRLSNYLEKRQLQPKLARLANSVLSSGSSVDALLVLWVVHLFEWGSARLENPTIGTIRRYVVALVERLHGALLALNRSPIDLNDGDWTAFFDGFLATETLGKVEKNALQSFHRFLVVQIGIEPVPAVFSAGEEIAFPKANVLWPDELKSAFLSIPRFTSDARLQKMLAAMLALGCGNPTRIGDLPGLTFGCIDSKNGKLRIDIAPRRGHHRGKSSAATRPLDYTDAPYSSSIREWLALRERDGEAGDDVLVFGDPNCPEKCFRLGLCLRLLNQILKVATGDGSASFHIFRHSWICDELASVLLAGGIPVSISGSHKAAKKAGHRNEWTTYTSYFHIPEGVIRHWIDRRFCAELDSPEVVGAWLLRLPNTLTVARSRSVVKAEYFSELMLSAAAAAVANEISNSLSEPEQHVTCIPALNGDGSYQQILFVLGALFEDRKLNVIAARNDTTADHVVRICRAVIGVSNLAISQGMRKHVPPGANSEFVVESAKSLLSKVFCTFPIVEPVLDGPLNALRNAIEPTEEMRAAAAAWVSAKTGKYLALGAPETASPMLNFLIGAGTPASNFFLSVAVKDPASEEMRSSVLSRPEVCHCLSVLERSAKTSLQVVAVCKAKGRPSSYLMLSRNRITGERACSSAEIRTNRLHALMLSLSVWIQVFK